MSLKEKIIFGILITYWGVIGIGLFAVSGFGNIPFLIGIGVLISLILLFFVKNGSSNIVGTCGLYLSSILILIGVSLLAVFFFRSNEPIYILLFLFSFTNFITTYYISKLSRVKNKITFG
jgi:hypothetical protein